MPTYRLEISPSYCENMTFSGETDSIRDALFSHNGFIENGINPVIYKDGKRITKDMLICDYTAYNKNSPSAAD